MYSVEDRFTFENLQEWVENAVESVDDVDNFVWALVGNKSDLPLEIEHDTILSRQEQLETDLSFFTSAKTGANVVSTFEKIIEAIHSKKLGQKSTRASSSASHSKPVIIGKTCGASHKSTSACC